MKPMLPTITSELPTGKDWYYETKFDGFRAILNWSKDSITLSSRNEKELLPLFPELQSFIQSIHEKMNPYLPIILDGELVCLENEYKANFKTIQTRGRMRSPQKIVMAAKNHPCQFLVFDILQSKGIDLSSQPYLERKQQLFALFERINVPIIPSTLIQAIPYTQNHLELWEKIVQNDGEGLIAKHKNSRWEKGKRTRNWLKYKNYKTISCFITAFEKTNNYFHVSVIKDHTPYPIGLFLHGLNSDEKQALATIIKENKLGEDRQFIYIKPAICLDINYLELYEGTIREPHFLRFRLDLEPSQCLYEQIYATPIYFPKDVTITHPDKPLWNNLTLSKADYLTYLMNIANYLLPFLKDRLLTVIRFPHGMAGEPFYQKNCPDYAPPFVETFKYEDINYILCNDIKTLIWLGNQLAFEFHIPFQTIHSKNPKEIVFDLDPPSRNDFHLAVRAALYIKEVLDGLHLKSFVKTSGNKGLQIYIPLGSSFISFEETRMFTSFIANYLIQKDSNSFTVERLKKNRGKRLYVDYIQHSEGKTIVAPYSVRGNTDALVATPLFWEEVNEKLTPEKFPLSSIQKRLGELGDPFQSYFKTDNSNELQEVLKFLKKKGEVMG